METVETTTAGTGVTETPGVKRGAERSRRGFGSIIVRRNKAGERIYYARYILDGRQHWESCGLRRKDAEARLAAVRKALAEGEALGVRPLTAATFEDFRPVVEPILRRHAPSAFETETGRYKILAGYFGAKPLHEVTTSDLRDFLLSRMVGKKPRRPAKPGTVNRWLSLVSVVFREAVARGYARANPAKGIKREREALKPVPFLGTADVAKLLAACPEDVYGPALVAVDCGLRRGEILGLRWADVDATAGKRGALVVRRSKSQPRIVPVTARVRDFLDRLRASRTGPVKLAGTEPVFPAFQGKRAERLTHALIAAAERAGFPGLTLHGLRHVYGSSLVRSGVPVSTVAVLLGDSLAVAMRYARHAPKGHEFEAVERLEAAREARPDAPVSAVGE